MHVRLPHTITVKSQSSVDSNGDQTFGSASTMQARVQNGRDRDSESIDHSAVVYTTSEIKADDRIWLPGDDTSDTSKARQPIAVTRSESVDGGFTLWKTLI